MEDTNKIINKFKQYIKLKLKNKKQVIDYFFTNELYMQLHTKDTLIDSIINGRFISVKRMKFEGKFIHNIED